MPVLNETGTDGMSSVPVLNETGTDGAVGGKRLKPARMGGLSVPVLNCGTGTDGSHPIRAGL